MTEDHANVRLFQQLDITDLAGCAHLFADDFVWHYFNAELPDLEGDYVGVAGLGEFFQKLGGATSGTFQSRPQAIAAYGDELVVTHVRNSLTLEGRSISFDAVVVWRVVEGRLTEAWDIPAVNTVTPETPT